MELTENEREFLKDLVENAIDSLEEYVPYDDRDEQERAEERVFLDNLVSKLKE